MATPSRLSSVAAQPTQQPTPDASAGSDYAQLKRRIDAAGLLDRSARRAAPRVLAVGAIIGVGVCALIVIGNSWWQLATAVYFSAAVAQLGFLAHDAGHQQIFRTRRWNDRFGQVVSNCLAGLSYGWWVDKHNRHHRYPNDVERDPDVGRSFIAWTNDQAEEQRGVIRTIARNQAWCFFPLLLLEALNLQMESFRGLVERKEHRLVEALLLTVHAVGGVLVVLWFMSPLHALAFIGLQQALLGLYLGASFAPNHKGMPLSAGVVDDDFLRRQVLTSRNVRGGWLMSTGFGALNYQIEHHLFPTMPSRNLRRARPIVKAFCAEHAISYYETTATDSYRQVLRYLGSIAPKT